MANLTLTIDDGTLRRARIKALELGTSVNAVVREYLRGYAGEDLGAAAMGRFADRAKASTSGSGGQQWSREDLHDRASLR